MLGSRKNTPRPAAAPFNAASTLLILSGAAALIYQVAWVRLLGLSMGSTSAAISTVLTAFFLGLAGGSYLAPRLLAARLGRLQTYAALELAIGLCGLLSLPLLLRLDFVMAWLAAGGGSPLWLKFAVSTGLLALPTLCIGATFPVLAAVVLRSPELMGRQLGRLYSLNTLGATLGAAGGGFVLIPRVGLDGAIYVACALNFAAAWLAWALRRQAPPGLPPTPPDAAPPPHRRRLLLLLFATGLAAIATEVGWSKYLAIFTGTTIYGFAAILTVFLLGIALGAWLGQWLLRDTRPGPGWLCAGLLALAATLLLARAGLTHLPLALDLMHLLSTPPEYRNPIRYGLVFLLLLAPTLCFGLLFPLALTLYCGDPAGARRGVGSAYAVNTAGSIVGAIAAGFWLIPRFGTDALLAAMAALPALLALLFINRRSWPAAGAVVLLLTGAWLGPGLDYRNLIASVRYGHADNARLGKTPTFLFLEEGKAAVISMFTYDGRLARLQSNGIQESFVGIDQPARPRAETLLGALPYLLHPEPRSAFVVGFGGGTTVQALAAAPLERIVVAELEPAVIRAARAVGAEQARTLDDNRVELRIDDARQLLLTEGRSYDLVISQPSHPWTAGAGNLFTLEFFRLVGSKLTEAGVYCQWVNLFNMDAATLRSVLQAFFAVFPHGLATADRGSGDLFLIGSPQALRFDTERMAERMAHPPLQSLLAGHGIDDPAELLWYFVLSRREALQAAGDVAPNTDTRLLTETRLAGLLRDPQGDASPYELLRRYGQFDVEPYLPPPQAAEVLYRAGRYFARRSPARARRLLTRLRQLEPALAQRLAAETGLAPSRDTP